MSHYWFFPSFTIKGPADGADVSDNAHMCTPASVYGAPAMCQALCTMTSPVLPSHLSSAVVNSLEMRKPVQRDHSFVSFHSLHRRSRNLNQSLCKSKARAVSITQHGWWAVRGDNNLFFLPRGIKSHSSYSLYGCVSSVQM